MKTPAEPARAAEPAPAENKPRGGQPHQPYYDNNNEYHNPHRDPFPSDRDLIRPAAFVFVCGALVLAIVAIIFLMMA